MTKKDYVLIAEAIVEGRKYATRIGNDSLIVSNTIGCLIDVLSDSLKAENERFDAHKFIRYIQQH